MFGWLVLFAVLFGLFLVLLEDWENGVFLFDKSKPQTTPRVAAAARYDYAEVVRSRMDQVRLKNPHLWSETVIEATKRRESERFHSSSVPQIHSKQSTTKGPKPPDYPPMPPDYPDTVRGRMDQCRRENPQLWSEKSIRKRELEWTEWKSD